MNIKQLIRNWLMSESSPGLVQASEAHLSERASGNGQPSYRVTLVKAMNGRLLEVGVFKPNPRGPDWTYELYVINDNETVADAIAKVLAIKSLEN
jgi:hypothetical protein